MRKPWKSMKTVRGYAVVNSLGLMCGLPYESKGILLHLNELGDYERVAVIEIREVAPKRRR